MDIYLRKINYNDKEIIEDLKTEIEEYDNKVLRLNYDNLKVHIINLVVITKKEAKM